jgi:hypothetical protein
MDALTGLAFQAVLFGVICWTMLRDMRRKPTGSFFRPVLLGFLPIFLLSAGSFATLESTPPDDLIKAEQAQATQFSNLLQSSSGAKTFTDEEMQSLVALPFRLQPAAVCIFWLALLTMAAMILRRWLAFKGHPLAPAPLSRWQAPDFLVWVLLVPAALLIFNQRGWLGEVETWISDLCLNVVLVVLTVYLFQGLMVLLDRISRFGLPKSLTSMLLIAALFLAVVPEGRGIILAFLGLGILDIWFNFRKLKPKHGDEERSSL